ncbi:hypothetical protein SRIMM317S_00857 [Streptomyces rimosus subsp. rimosus]
MPAPLRAALELAYFQRRDDRQTAADLGVTEDEGSGAGSAWACSCSPPRTTTGRCRPPSPPSPRRALPGYGRQLCMAGRGWELGYRTRGSRVARTTGRARGGPQGPGSGGPSCSGGRPRIPSPRTAAEDSGPLPDAAPPAAPGVRTDAADTAGYDDHSGHGERRGPAPGRRPRASPAPGPEVAARRLGPGRLLRRGDGRPRRGAPHGLRRLRGRGAAPARRGRPAAPRRSPRPGPAAASTSWRAASGGARPVSRCPSGRRRTTPRRRSWTRCSATWARRSGGRRCGCAGSRASARPSGAPPSPGSSGI